MDTLKARLEKILARDYGITDEDALKERFGNLDLDIGIFRRGGQDEEN